MAVHIKKYYKAYIIALMAILICCVSLFCVFALRAAPVVLVKDNGSRLVATIDGASPTSYQWQKSSDGTSFSAISGANLEYYDITSDDSGQYLRVVINGVVSEVVGPIKNVIIFDLSRGNVTIGTTLSGYSPEGVAITGAHSANNVYVIMQSNNSSPVSRNIYLKGSYQSAPFDITLQELNMGVAATNANQAPGNSGVNTPSAGSISIPASGETKNVILRLRGENIIRNITYYNGGDTSNPTTTKSSLKITDINGDGEVSGGSLYMPIKVNPEDIDSFVATKKNYNHWNAAIGGLDSTSLVQNLTIAGGKLQVLTTLGDNCTAIGAGGNGYGQVTITGGEVVAHCNGTGAAIGGGIGWNAAGGLANVTITGGKVYAKNHSNIVSGSETVGGVAIGGGSSFHKAGAGGTVTISGGYVEAYGTFGNGIGGGNSSTDNGGTETVNISGGTVISNSIGGGNSKRNTGGSATVNVSGTANVTITKGIGGGLSQAGTGGEATIKVTGGILNCAGIIGGGQGSGTGNGGGATITVEGGTLMAGGIGGGNAGDTGIGGAATIKVTGGLLDCAGGIGGGQGSGTGNGGSAKVTVSNGQLTAQSVGGGVGGQQGNGGSAEIYISGGSIETGSIGGGTTLNPTGNLGYAKAEISGGDIQGQFIMSAGGTEPCTFTMTGGTLRDVNTLDNSKYSYAQQNGGAVYMNDPNGVATLSGGEIKNCSAQNGGAVYMTAGTFTISGEGSISNCFATESGGAVYLGGGSLNVNGGQISANNAIDGGGVFLANGSMYVTDGKIENNIATGSGGGAFVNGGNAYVSGGSVSKNKASANGGGIAINNGNYLMKGGNVNDNVAQTGNGGGIYISSEGQDVIAEILMGSVSRNSAGISGGALAVKGKEDAVEEIKVTSGVNIEHIINDDGDVCCDHDGDGVEDVNACPIIVNNVSKKSGGALFVSGGDKTILNIYCLVEEGSKTGDKDKTALSDFMMVEGGTVELSTASQLGDDEHMHGYIEIKNTMQVTAGKVDLYGSMANPKILADITVDITDEEDYFRDHREGTEYFKIVYYENFTDPSSGITTGQYTSRQVPAGTLETISGVIYRHDGYEIKGWFTQPNGDGDKYEVGQTYAINQDLFIYAIWISHSYDVVFNPNIPIDIEYSGEMPTLKYIYDIEYTLPKNEYVYNGYRFENWVNKKTGLTYIEGQKVKNLSAIDGDVVELVVNWKKCTHQGEDAEFIYSAEGNVLIRKCTCGGYVQKATINANNAVYDGLEHGATINISQDSINGILPPNVWQDLDITYLGDVESGQKPIDAGEYIASITATDKTASKKYIIEKAKQIPPPNVPTYASTIVDSGITNKITVTPSVLDDSSKEHEYRVAYMLDNVLTFGDWQDSQIVTLPVSHTHYIVYVRYKETRNLLPSEATRAEESFYYQENILIKISYADEGLYCYCSDSASGDGLDLNVIPLPGYYIGENFDIISQTSINGEVLDNSNALSALVSSDKTKLYRIPSNNAVEITLTIYGGKRLGTTGSFVESSIVFSEIDGVEAHVTNDSAFTAYFELFGCNVYENFALTTDKMFPTNTSIVLYDRNDDSYWYYNVTSSTQSVLIEQFVLMGEGVTKYKLSSDESRLQFVVDFSKTDGAQVGCWSVTLSADVKVQSAGFAPEFDTILSPVNVQVYDKPQFSVALSQEQSDNGLEVGLAVDYAYIESNAIASKWQDRKGSLVLTSLSTLPFDANIKATYGTTTKYILKNNNGDFIVPLGENGRKIVNITLNSEMFPIEYREYAFSVRLYSSLSNASGSPMNGDCMGVELVITFVKEVQNTPSIKITDMSSTDRIYKTGDKLRLYIEMQDVLAATPSLMLKGTDNKYANTGWAHPIITSSGEIDINLAGQKEGSYCVQLAVKDATGVNILIVSYYFIINNG